MHYTLLKFKNYRSYKDYVATFSPGVNIIVGPNASGKTNLLEALLVISRGSSYRAQDSDLIYFNKPWARLEAETNTGHQRIITLEKTDEKVIKSLKIDNVKIKKLTQNKIIPVVLFEPDHLRMIHGSPTARRDYIDGILQSTTPGYSTLLRSYKRIISQRNKLLKTPNTNIDDFFIWDVRLAEIGEKIVKNRLETIQNINKRASTIYTLLSNIKTTILLEYDTTIQTDNYATTLNKRLQHNIHLDKQRGFTSLGPHREDIIFNLNNHNAQHTASRGETRTLILMCKLVELELLEVRHDTKPLLLLDDVFSELDSARRHAITEYLKDYQTIITTTDADAVIGNFIGEYKVIPLTKED